MAFESLSEKLTAAFKRLRGKGRLSAGDVKEAMREVRMALLEADVSYKVVKDFTKKVTDRAVGTDVLEALNPAQMVIKIVNEELCAMMGGQNQRLNIGSKSPSVVMLVGLQGAGKTTNGAKLAGYMRKQGKRPLLVACDVYRPAAIKQLETVGAQLDIPVFQMGQTNPVDIAKAGVEYARKHGCDLVFLDTAGRLHIDEALMNELREIKAATEPAEVMLVVDAMTGQDAVNAASAFDEALDVTGVLLSKLDGDARGGAALSIRAATGKPIKFMGVGEKLDAVEPFHPDRMANRILGMGDVLTLIEKAEQSFDEKKALEADDPRHGRQGAQGREDGRQGSRAPGGHHPLHDPGRARQSLVPQLQPQKAYRRRLRHLRRRSQPPAQAVRDDAVDGQAAVRQEHEKAAAQDGPRRLPRHRRALLSSPLSFGCTRRRALVNNIQYQNIILEENNHG